MGEIDNVVLNEKVINWVFDNRFSLKTTKKDIVEGYEKFLTMFPIDMELPNSFSFIYSPLPHWSSFTKSSTA
jgi:hypothetical protein